MTNFVVMSLVAHFSNTRDFGAYALLYAAFLVSSGINRGLVCEPLIIRFSTADDAAWRNASYVSVTRSAIFGVGVGATFAIATEFAPANFRPLGFVFAIGAFALFVQDCLRYAALARARPHAAIANDVTVFAVQIAVSSFLVASHQTGAASLAAAWIFSSLLGAIIGASRLHLLGKRRTFHSLGSEHRAMATRLGADNAILMVAQQSIGYVVAGVGGLPAAASLRAGQTAYSPLSTLALSLQSALIPEMARANQRSVKLVLRISIMVGFVLAVLSTVYLLIITHIPRSVGEALLGPSWTIAEPILLLLGISSLSAIPTNVSQATLRALGETSRIIRARFRGIGLFAAVALPLTALGQTKGAAIGLAGGTLLQSLVWAAALRSAYQERSNRQDRPNGCRLSICPDCSGGSLDRKK